MAWTKPRPQSYLALVELFRLFQKEWVWEEIPESVYRNLIL